MFVPVLAGGDAEGVLKGAGKMQLVFVADGAADFSDGDSTGL